ncbi:interferon-inducible double-stranded RNA-dependent protein kinase activator A homolog A-like [Protopterus annectens]|uniref:interferon-inducible double-stranded RNA-dependent protein kinase activator A homolog A-like n=1 Tax=Protopterus annectens TaxID=7888 RepID=UPI001CF9481E|nr:interferon-inducible double-stranded RNA-dependent protein kinase activator A homolog A-like [Protopterus annectens]
MSRERFQAASKRSSAKMVPSLEQIMENSPGKTPLQILHEYGTKVDMIPVYEQEKSEGQAHLPTFIFKVTVGEVSSTGQGQTKKAAKQKAAESLLNIMKGDHSISAALSETVISDTIQPPSPPIRSHCNPVGTLQVSLCCIHLLLSSFGLVLFF